MSLSLTDELRVALSPAQVTLTRVGRELTPRGLARPLRESRSVACAPAGGGAARWHAALEALGTALAGVSRPIGPATVLLSNHFVRYVVVPWSDALAGPDEDAAYARNCFTDLYGDLAAPWELRVSPGRIGAPRIASATERELLDALRETFARAQLELRSIQPHLMAACNDARNRLRGRSAWVVLPESEALCVGLLNRGEWVRLRSLRVGSHWQRELPLLLQREALMADAEAPGKVVLLPPCVGTPRPRADARTRRRRGIRRSLRLGGGMRRLRLDYQRSARIFPWVGASLLALAVLLLAAVAVRFHEVDQQVAAAESRLEQAQRKARRGSVRMSEGEARALGPEVRVANQALRQLTRPWQPLFEAVESSTGSEVALLSLEPDLQKGVVRIGAEARNEQAMLGYMRRLMRQPVFGDVHLQNHQVQQNDAQRPVRFSVVAEWRELP